MTQRPPAEPGPPGPGRSRRDRPTPTRRLAAAATAVAALAAVAAAALAFRPPDPTGPTGGAVALQERAPISDSAFGALVAKLSEDGGYFDTDNLISNEASYLHVIDRLAERGVEGGAYIGVGPDQNFSYIAAVRPALAFVVDIRRDNLLQHLWFKALFRLSPTRLDYLCLMVARRCGGDASGLDVDALVARVDAAPRVAAPDSLIDRVVRQAGAAGVPLDVQDRATIRAIHRRFAVHGLGLRFSSHGRAPLPEYPTLRRLIVERDGAGRPASYLATDRAYGTVRDLQGRNRVVPVVGDLAGEHALRAIGLEIARRDLGVSALYTSNVELYLFRGGSFAAFVANVGSLPLDADAVIVRSYFNRSRRLPGTRPGYASTQLLDDAAAFLARWEEGRVASYSDLVRGSRPP